MFSVNGEEVYISQHSVFIKVLHNILHKIVFFVQLNINNKPMSTFLNLTDLMWLMVFKM